MHMVANFWPGATLKKFQVELAQLEDKKQPQAQLLRTVAEVEGGLKIVSLWEGSGGGSLLRAAWQLSGWGQSCLPASILPSSARSFSSRAAGTTSRS